MKYTLCALSLACLLMVGGCGSDPHYATSMMMTPHGEEPLMVADGDLAQGVALANEAPVMEKRTPGGMLMVTLRLTNVTNYPVNILLETQFREEDNSPIENDKSTTIEVIEPGQIKEVVLRSTSPKAYRYSVMMLKHNSGPRPVE